jgi:outer membrane protein assembly factor BamB
MLKRRAALLCLLGLLIGIAAYQYLRFYREEHRESPPEIEKFQADEERLARLHNAKLLLPASSAVSEDWSQWRGPERDGFSPLKLASAPWSPEGPRRIWIVPGGPGHSGLAVAGDRVFTLVQMGEEETALCLDAASGRKIWSIAWAAKFSDASSGTGPRATPTVVDGRVYVLGSTGKFHCLGADSGKILWSHSLPDEFRCTRAYGYSCSPLVNGARVVVLTGSAGDGSIAAFDGKDGRRLWTAGTEAGGYSSPLAATLAGAPQILGMTGESVFAVAPEDGRILWTYPWTTWCGINVATPIVTGNYVFVSSGYGKGCALLEIQRDPNGAFRALPVYEHNRMRNQFSTSVLYRDAVYGFDEELLVCMELRSGKIRWKERGYGKGSVVGADGRLLVLGDSGRLALVEATPDAYRELASCTVSKTRCWTSPSLARGRLFIRDQESIQCFSVGPD